MVALVTLTVACIMTTEKGEVRYGGQYYPGEFLLFGLGDDIWEKYDINVTHILFTSAGESNEALISGTIDINCGADQHRRGEVEEFVENGVEGSQHHRAAVRDGVVPETVDGVGFLFRHRGVLYIHMENKKSKLSTKHITIEFNYSRSGNSTPESKTL